MPRSIGDSLPLLTLLLISPLLLPVGALAAPFGFELDLKELKKPPVTVLQPPPAAPSTTRQQAVGAATPTKTRPVMQPAKPAKRPTPASAPAVPPPTEEQLILLDSITACPLAHQLLEALAEPLAAMPPAAEGLLPVVASVRRQGVTAFLACGLPAAEAYTFGRLLEAEGVQLISLSGKEQPVEVIQAVALGLGLTYRQLQETPPSFLTSDPQGKPLRLIVRAASLPH